MTYAEVHTKLKKEIAAAKVENCVYVVLSLEMAERLNDLLNQTAAEEAAQGDVT